MGNPHIHQGPFDIPDVPNFIPRRIKPLLFIFFVIIIQLSGSVYLAAAGNMVGDMALMKEDIMMAGYAQIVGMSVNFAVMFRLKFRFSLHSSLLTCCTVLIIANLICANTQNVPLLVVTCFIAGWFRMWATFMCNSTIQLWLTPVRDMSIFFCYVYLIVDGAIQLNGIVTIYTTYFTQWQYVQLLMIGLLLLEMLMVITFVKRFRSMPKIPLYGIDWIGAILWSLTMLCLTFICVYGNYYDWWDADEIIGATVLGLACLGINLWRASFLRHPYISFQALKNRNVIRASIIYLVFFTLMSTEHVLEHSYAAVILGFDDLNIIDLNWYALTGMITGIIFTYFTFACYHVRYRTMTTIAFSLCALYLAYFYFVIDYNIEKEMLFIPLFCRGFASVIISIIFLTSIVQSGLPFQIFPQGLSINGFTGAVISTTVGPALVGELFSHIVAKNTSFLSSAITNTTTPNSLHIAELFGLVQGQALVVSMKEIFGWMLIATLAILIIIMISYEPIRPSAFMPKWSKIRRIIRHESRMSVIDEEE